MKNIYRRLQLCAVLTLSASLCACTALPGTSQLDNEPDLSIDIQMPYPTITPAPDVRDKFQVLEIGSNGSVVVHDPDSLFGNASVIQSGSTSNYKSLRLGSTGLAVQVLQARLIDLGYMSGNITGVFDSETEAAVRRFEQYYGIMQTGVASAAFQVRLFDAEAPAYLSAEYNNGVVAQYVNLQPGDTGSGVYALQQRLRSLGYPVSDLTGAFDDATSNAVRMFYEAYGLSPSSYANVALQKELYSENARAYSNAEENPVQTLPENSNDEMALQTRLYELGYLLNPPTGQVTNDSLTAVRLFETVCGQLPSGSMNSMTLDMLYSEHATDFATAFAQYSNLIEGSGGDAVINLQARLIELGFAVGSPNGDYAAATTAAVRLFQQANYLNPTGIANVYTQAVMFSSFALNIDEQTSISVQKSEPDQPDSPKTETALDIVQNRLAELGFLENVTGTEDELTRQAICDFQDALGIPATGEITEDLVRFIQTSAAPTSGEHYHGQKVDYAPSQKGDESNIIANLKRRLVRLGYLTQEAADENASLYDSATANAISEIQLKLGYPVVDGRASSELMAYLSGSISDEIRNGNS